jgi:hypothetical protein
LAAISGVAAGGELAPMLLTADQHRRLAEVFEEAVADQIHTPEIARCRRRPLGFGRSCESNRERRLVV